MMEIDATRLPEYAMLDTGVLIRALGERPEDPRAQACRDFFDAMLQNGKRLAVAAPTLAEMLRGNAHAPPSVEGVVVIPFDQSAAVACGKHFPRERLEGESRATGESKSYLKYDAQIIACAMAHHVPQLITIDSHQARRAAKAGLKAASPDSFYASQTKLELVGGSNKK